MNGFYPIGIILVIDEFDSNVRIFKNGEMPKPPYGLDLFC
jgi:hypothetical protein